MKWDRIPRVPIEEDEMDSFSPDWVNLWSQWLRPVIEFIIGLGLVVFVHELGHFGVAKAVGIKVDQFALGFGPRLLGLRKKETDYRINLLPLGGYVKMVGQEDFGPLPEQTPSDPRAFNAQPVGSRFAVISAGVVMNIIFASLLFILVGMVGIRFPAPMVGGTIPGSPASSTEIRWNMQGASTAAKEESLPAKEWMTFGLQPGDRILRINDKRITRFSQIPLFAALAIPGQKFKMIIERQAEAGRQTGTTEVGVASKGGRLAFGIVPAPSTTFAGLGDYIAEDPFQKGDRIIAINGQRIKYSWQMGSMEKTFSGGPVTLTLRRGDAQKTIRWVPHLRIKDGVFFSQDGNAVAGQIVAFPEKDQVVLRLPDGEERKLSLKEVHAAAGSELLDILGLVPRLKILGVIRDSPAAQAGLKPGDVIEEYGGQRTPTMKQFLQISEKTGNRPTPIVVIRGGRKLPPMELRPIFRKGRFVVGILQGLDEANSYIAHIRPGSPAARAGLASGDVFIGVNGRRTVTWIELFNVLKGCEGKTTRILYRRQSQGEGEAVIGPLTRAIFDPNDYRYLLFPGPRGFYILMGNKVEKKPLAAVAWGVRETWNFLAMTYGTIIGYLRGNISYREFRGPVGIGSIAIAAGRMGFQDFMFFLAVISISLAVVNFLPIPAMDGGHAVFLLIEKVRGKPLPLKAQNAITMTGMALLFFVLFALTWSDVSRILGSLW
jgi:regulator of sigma E protease